MVSRFSTKYLSWFLPCVERAEILTIFPSYFGWNDDFINSFWNLLTIRLVVKNEQKLVNVVCERPLSRMIKIPFLTKSKIRNWQEETSCIISVITCRSTRRLKDPLNVKKLYCFFIWQQKRITYCQIAVSSEMVFCYLNCSDLLWEKIVLVIEKNFWNSRLKAENFQKFWDH